MYWFQKIGETPVLRKSTDGSNVVYGRANCPGVDSSVQANINPKLMTFSNEVLSEVTEHPYENFFCQYCEQVNEAAFETETVDGIVYYCIYNAEQLDAFASLINNTPKKDLNAKLMNNIVYNENVLKEDGTLNTEAEDTFRE